MPASSPHGMLIHSTYVEDDASDSPETFTPYEPLTSRGRVSAMVAQIPAPQLADELASAMGGEPPDTLAAALARPEAEQRALLERRLVQEILASPHPSARAASAALAGSLSPRSLAEAYTASSSSSSPALPGAAPSAGRGGGRAARAPPQVSPGIEAARSAKLVSRSAAKVGGGGGGAGRVRAPNSSAMLAAAKSTRRNAKSPRSAAARGEVRRGQQQQREPAPERKPNATATVHQDPCCSHEVLKQSLLLTAQ